MKNKSDMGAGNSPRVRISQSVGPISHENNFHRCCALSHRTHVIDAVTSFNIISAAFNINSENRSLGFHITLYNNELLKYS